MSTRIRITQEEFLKRCVDTRGVDKFDYSLVNYTGSFCKITIICKLCNNNWQVIPGNFTWLGHGCPTCRAKNRKISPSRLSTNEVIARCKAAQPDSCYDYSEVNYVSSKHKMTIICPSHGKFYQTFSDHSRGHGCKECGILKLLATKESLGIIGDQARLSEFKKYSRRVRQLTKKTYRLHADKIANNGLCRNMENHLDHIFSITHGFENNVPVEIIAHYTNLQIINGMQNRIKHINSDITLDTLMTKYNHSTTYTIQD